MIGRCVGLEIGAATVRAARVRRSFRGAEIEACTSRPFNAQVLAQLHAEGWGRYGPVVVSVPEAEVLVRNMELPFTEDRQLAKVLPFEFEELVPVGLDQVAVDYERLLSVNDKTAVLAMGVPKAVLERRLSLLSGAGFRVQRVSVASLALKAYYERLTRERVTRAILLNLDEGPESTATLCALQQDGLANVRTLTGNLMHELFLAEIRRTVRLWAEERHTSFDVLLLSGSPGILQSARDRLAGSLQIADIRVLGSERTGPHSWDSSFVVAAGLAAMGPTRPGHLDFGRHRKPAPVRVGTAGSAGSRKGWAALLVAVFVVLVLALTSLVVRYQAQQARYAELAGAVTGLFQETFPGVPAENETRQAKALLADAQKRWAYLGGGEPRVLDLLSELTTRLPKDSRTEIQDLGLEAGRLWFEAETDSFESVDRLKAELARSPQFDEVTVQDARSGPKGGRVRVRLQMSVRRG